MRLSSYTRLKLGQTTGGMGGYVRLSVGYVTVAINILPSVVMSRFVRLRAA